MTPQQNETSELLGEIKAYQAAPTRCSIPKMLEGLGMAERKAVESAFEDDSIQSTAITRFLIARGVNIGSHTIQRHRRQACGCVRHG